MQDSISNIVGWVLTVCGVLSSVAAVVGIAYFAVTPDERSVTEAAASLHDTYYIIHRSRGVIWPLLLCLALSAAIAIIGYTLTTHHLVRTLREYPSSISKALTKQCSESVALV